MQVPSALSWPKADTCKHYYHQCVDAVWTILCVCLYEPESQAQDSL